MAIKEVKTIGWLNKVYDWLEERFHISALGPVLEKKTIPIHKHTIWYFPGGILLFLFALQVVTGIMLLLYYQPDAEHAHESLLFIMEFVPYGWLIRGIHAYASWAMIFLAMVHLFSTLFLKAYRKPREFTWLTGFALMMLVLAFGFTGYSLCWDMVSLFATKVGSEIAGQVPIIGKQLSMFMRGGEMVTEATLPRMYGLHICALPIATALLIGLHLLFVQLQGASVPISIEKKKNYREIPFFPDFLYRDAIVWLVILFLLVCAAIFFPKHLGEKADVMAVAPEGIEPEWYFMFAFQLLKILPAKMLFMEGRLVGVLILLFGVVLFVFIPFIDRKSARGEESRWVGYLGWAAIAFIIIMTVFAYSGH